MLKKGYLSQLKKKLDTKFSTSKNLKDSWREEGKKKN